jgi:hypothetical protein
VKARDIGGIEDEIVGWVATDDEVGAAGELHRLNARSYWRRRTHPRVVPEEEPK